MAKYFMGSVGEARAEEIVVDEFTKEILETRLAFTSKTLTDSAVNVSIQKEDIIDSYNGAPAGVFYHSPNINITLSDVLWQPEFLEYSLGQRFSDLLEEGSTEYCTVKLITNNVGVATLTSDYRAPKAVDFPGMQTQNNAAYYLVIAKREQDSDWVECSCTASGSNFIFGATDNPNRGELAPNTEYCFRYMTSSLKSRELLITTKILPAELRLTITTPLFVADGCSEQSLSMCQHAGYLVYEVPRWALNADLSLSATMSGTQGMQLVGTVLEAIDNEEGSPMMKIKEFIPARPWWEGLLELYWTDSGPVTESGKRRYKHIYGLYSGGECKEITSTASNVRLAFSGINALSDSADKKISIDGDMYNVTGVFSTSGSLPTPIKVSPAVVQSTDEGKEIIVVLDSMEITLH